VSSTVIVNSQKEQWNQSLTKELLNNDVV